MLILMMDMMAATTLTMIMTTVSTYASSRCFLPLPHSVTDRAKKPFPQSSNSSSASAKFLTANFNMYYLKRVIFVFIRNLFDIKDHAY